MGLRRAAFADELKRTAAMIVDFFAVAVHDEGVRILPRGWLHEYDAHDRMINGTVIDFLRRFGDKSTSQGRRWLQFFGTECMRSVLPDIWVQAVLHRVKMWPGTVVDDMRFINEANALRDSGFVLVRIETPEEIRRERILKLYPNYDFSRFNHASETNLDDWTEWDMVVDGSRPLNLITDELAFWLRSRQWT